MELDQALYGLQQPYDVSLPQGVQRLIVAAGGADRLGTGHVGAGDSDQARHDQRCRPDG